MKKFFLLILIISCNSKSGVFRYTIDISNYNRNNDKVIGLLNALETEVETEAGKTKIVRVVSNFSNKKIAERHAHAYIKSVSDSQGRTVDLTGIEIEIDRSNRPYHYLNYLGFTSLGLLAGYYLWGSKK